MTDLDLFSYLETQKSPSLPATARSRTTDPSTSQMAAAMTERGLSEERARVLKGIAMHQGVSREAATSNAATVATYLGSPQNNVASRITELRKLGYVEDSGRTRPGHPNRAGQCSPQIIWVLTDKGRELYERLRAGE